MAREDRFTTTEADAGAFERAHHDAGSDRDVPSPSDLLDDGIGGDWNLTRSDSEWAAAARSLWGEIVPQDEPPF